MSRLKVDEALYYFAFAIFSIQCAIERTTFTEILFIPIDEFTSLTQALIVFSLISKYIMQRASFKCWAFSLAIVLISFISWRQSGESSLFWASIFIVCANNVRIRPLAKIALTVSFASLIITILSAGFGVIENKVFVRGGITRYALGFNHPNALGLYLFNACVAFSALRFGKNPIPDFGLIAVSILTYFLVAVFIVIIVSAYLMIAYDPSNPIQFELNKLLSGRLRLANGYFEMQPITLFGSDFSGLPPIYWENGVPSAFVVDNAWCHLLLRFGLIPAFCFLFGYIAILIKAVRQGWWNSIFFGLVLMSIYGLCETLGIHFECNYFLFAVGAELLYTNVFMSEKSSATGRSYSYFEIGNDCV